jgi:adenosylmethionine-8-amino-7-oxononanoate aminotransferase
MQLRPPVEHIIKKTSGYWVETEQKRFLDLQLGYSAYTWGYNNKNLLEAYITGIKDNTCVIRHDQTCEILERVNRLLLAVSDMEAVLWTISGSDAIEAAIQIALQYQNLTFKRTDVLSFSPGYHGCTWFNRALKGERKLDNVHVLSTAPWTLMQEREQAEQATWKALLYKLDNNKQIGTIILESMPWYEGVRPWSEWWWGKMTELQNSRDIIIIMDDIAGGFGKVSPFVSHKRFNFKPDIIAVAKALTGGHAPSSCAMASNKILPVLRQDTWWHGHTWHPYIPSLYLIEKNIEMTDITNFDKIEHTLNLWLNENQFIKSYRGIGLMRELFFESDIDDNQLINCGLIVSKKRSNSMSLIVPQIADDEYWVELTKRISQLTR